MKVIFLDFDGVLNSKNYFDCGVVDSGVGWEANQIDSRAVARLNRIVEATGALIVVSSTWRLGKTVPELQALLNARGFRGRVLDKTGDHPPRCAEIAAWMLEWHDMGGKPPLSSFVILDDDRVGWFGDREINTSFERGLEDSHVERAIALLNGKV